MMYVFVPYFPGTWRLGGRADSTHSHEVHSCFLQTESSQPLLTPGFTIPGLD